MAESSRLELHPTRTTHLAGGSRSYLVYFPFYSGGRLESRTLKAFTLDCFQDSCRLQSA